MSLKIPTSTLAETVDFINIVKGEILLVRYGVDGCKMHLAYRWVRAILLEVPIQRTGTYNSIALTHRYVQYII